MLWIDYLCLRSSEFNYLRSLCEAWRHSKNLDWLPNFAYSEVRHLGYRSLGTWVPAGKVQAGLKLPRSWLTAWLTQAMAYFMEAHESDDSEHAETLRALGALRLQTALIRSVQWTSQLNGTKRDDTDSDTRKWR